jgi:MoaA/NifB/PqqE/SkfB family radical SAM enzyme
MFATNGLLLDKKTSRKLISEGLKSINFSMDAATAETYRKIRSKKDLATVCENIRNLVASKEEMKSSSPDIIMNMVIMKENEKEIPQFVRLADSLGVKTVQIRLLIPLLRNYEVRSDDFYFNYNEQRVDPTRGSFREIIRSAKEIALQCGIHLVSDNPHITNVLTEKKIDSGIQTDDKPIWLDLHGEVDPEEFQVSRHDPVCKRAWMNVLIELNGDVKICCLAEHIIGNLNDHELPDIWNGPVIEDIRAHFLRNDLPDLCIGCTVIPNILFEDLDVKRTGNSGFRQGWHEPDPSGHKWMNGHCSRIRFITDGRKKYLEMGFLAGLMPGNGYYYVELLVNGIYHESFEVPGHGNKFTRYFQLPEHPEGKLLIEFRSTYTWKPSNLDPDSDDNRTFGGLAVSHALLKDSVLLERIDVSRTGDLGFVEGWHPAEPGRHKWMDGARGRFCFSTDGSREYLEICLLSGLSVKKRPYRIKLFVNGKKHHTFDVPGDRTQVIQTCLLPKHAKGLLFIELRSKHLWRPADMEPGSADERRLGPLALLHAELKNEELLETIDARLPGTRGFMDGWQPREPLGHHWMGDTSSRIRFFTDGTKRFLEIGYITAPNPEGTPYHVKIVVNGTHRDTFTASGKSNRYVRTFPLPKHERGPLTVDFLSDHIWSPSDSNPGSEDARRLGAIGLSYATVKEEPNRIIENQFLIDSEIQKKKAKIRSYPAWMVLGLTNRCNLKCVMCGLNTETPDTEKIDMPVHRLNKVRKVYPYLTDVSLSGGEPLMHKGFGEILKDMGSQGTRGINFYTNGLLLNEKKAELLLDYSNNIAFIAVSLDASTKATYKKIRGANLDLLIRNLRRFTALRAKRGLTFPKLYLNYVMTRTTIEELPDLVKLAGEIGVERVELQPLLAGWDFTVEKDGFTFDYKQENIRNYPELSKSVIDKTIETAKKHSVNLDLMHGIHRFYQSLHADSEIEAATIPPRFDFNPNFRHDFSRQHLEAMPGGPICRLPWQMLVLRANGNLYNCCWSNPFAQIDDHETFEELWNCEALQNIRSELLNGRFAPECKTPNCPAFKSGRLTDITVI